ncbi:hypothetical protein PCL_08611 [Purpureocillium lilacinum]|uniref:Uncharacterized protein n=1 Tax=Purpureocillium lilacinum TaxID=33203 RepID=A0A2U3DR62_PURLI|nr:hypothetical protein PCL_08611 [Purpureocillium lilacinum]
MVSGRRRASHKARTEEVPLRPSPFTVFVPSSASGNVRCHAMAKRRSDVISGTLDVRIVASACRETDPWQARQQNALRVVRARQQAMRSACLSTSQGSHASARSTTGFSSTTNDASGRRGCRWRPPELDASVANGLVRETHCSEEVLLPSRLMGNPNEAAM